MSLLSKYINRQLAAYQSELVQTHYQEVDFGNESPDAFAISAACPSSVG